MLEMIEIVDIDRKKTGKILPRGEKRGKEEYFLSVHVWIVNSNGELFIQQRSSQKKVCPNLWSVCGGVVDAGETSFDAAQRETLEEIGVDISSAHMELVGQAFEPDEWGSLVDVWLVKTDFPMSNVILQLTEVCDAKWADMSDVSDLIEKKLFAQNVLFALDNVLDNCGLR